MKPHRTFATLAGLLLAVSAHAQTSAGSAPIGKAVSGNNATAAGTSGTGLRTDGTAETGSRHDAAGREAAGVDGKNQVTGKSTAVLGVSAKNADNVNAQATNTTAPDNKDATAAASGGRGKAGTRAEKEIVKANSRAVHEVPGDRSKTATAAEAGREKQAASKRKGQRKAAEGRTGS